MSVLRLCAVALFGASLFAQAAPPLRVGKITIRNLDVYTQAEAARGLFYRTADRLHIETKQSVVESFLLFREGEEYHPERLAETERNLRALRFLKSATVTPSAPHDGVVDVTVITQDAWSISPETQGGSKGGSSTYGVNLSDGNMFGYGKDVSVGWDKGADRTRSAIEYNDPSFFAPYWNAKFRYGSNSDGYEHRVVVKRPFYSFATPWAVDFVYDGLRQSDKLYDGGLESERFRQKHRVVIASAGTALDPNDASAQRLTAGIRMVHDDFFTLNGTTDASLPSQRDFHYVFLRYDHVDNDFLKLDFVNKDVRFEDFNLGRQYSVEGAVSPSAFGSERTTGFARVAAGRGTRVSDDGFVLPTVSMESRFDGGFENAIASSSVLFVHRLDDGSDHPRTFVARATALTGWRTDHDLQFFADGVTGLRGYRMHTFEGSRAFIVNIEERFYLGREVLQLASPGIVAFADFGNASDGGFTDLMHLKTDIGAGIRVGLPRTPKNLLRLDFAYALNRDPLGRRGWLISFSSGQAF